ncbi:MAG: hypothetical protein Q4G18_11300 [Myroides sp.]|nr:hypothetical protein [Myroides sp.]
MKYLLILLFGSSLLFSQERDIKGYVFYEDEFIPIPEVMILNSNDKLIAETDINGCFTFKLDDFNKTFFTAYLGLQSETVHILETSDIVYIFLMNDQIIDFVSLKKAKRLINRDRKKMLKKIYKKAISKGIISKNSIYNKQNIIID